MGRVSRFKKCKLELASGTVEVVLHRANGVYGFEDSATVDPALLVVGKALDMAASDDESAEADAVHAELGAALGTLCQYVYDHIHSVKGLAYEAQPDNWLEWSEMEEEQKIDAMKREPFPWVSLVVQVRGSDVADDPN